MKLIPTIIASSVIATAMLTTSCSTIKQWYENVVTNPQKVEQIAKLLKTGTYYGVREAVKREPKSATYFAAAAVAIRLAVDTDAVSPEQLVASIEEVIDADSQYYDVFVDGLTLSLKAYKQFYDLNNFDGKLDPRLKIVLLAIAEGIDEALETPSGKAVGTGVNPLENVTDEQLKL